MLGNADLEGVGAQMSDLAEKFHGRLGVTAFQFTVGGAHAAEILDLTARTNGLARTWRLANFAETSIPSFRETSVTQVVAVLMRDHADGHAAGGVDGTAVLPAAAVVSPGTQGTVLGSKLVFGKPEVFSFSDGIAEFEIHGLFGRETHGKRALGAIGARIDERVKLEFDADFFLGKTLHSVNFVDIEGSWDSL